VSCLAEQAKILVAEGEENNLDAKVMNERWHQWDTCGLCKQDHHGVVCCALGWACWKTYLGRPETDGARRLAMGELGNGLFAVKHNEDALSVMEAVLATQRRVGETEHNILAMQSNLAGTYGELGLLEKSLSMKRDVYSGYLRLHGEEHENTLLAASNYASSFKSLERFEEARSVFRKAIPVARRGFGESHELTLKMRWIYAKALYEDDSATLDNLREALTTLEEIEPTARRVLGGAHPTTAVIGRALQNARAALGAREAA
jgi:tetratricopeptide (TPR) repeat protein